MSYSSPNFFMIGATKSGTTSMYVYLKQHPEIFMPEVKEPHFFAFQPNSRVSYIQNGKRREPNYVITDPEAYQQLFAAGKRARAVGEASAMYIYLPGTIARIRSQHPDAKLIAVLRNPVERAYSAYLHHRRDDLEPCATFAEALNAEPDRIAKGWAPLYAYQDMGFYHRQLSRVLEAFPRDQLHVILYDDLKAHALKVAQETYRFLEVDDTFAPDVKTRYNISGIPKNKLLHGVRHYLLGSDGIKARVKHLLPPVARANFKRKVVASIEARNLTKPSLLPEDKARLQTVYREDILALQGLLERDLSAWLE